MQHDVLFAAFALFDAGGQVLIGYRHLGDLAGRFARPIQPDFRVEILVDSLRNLETRRHGAQPGSDSPVDADLFAGNLFDPGFQVQIRTNRVVGPRRLEVNVEFVFFAGGDFFEFGFDIVVGDRIHLEVDRAGVAARDLDRAVLALGVTGDVREDSRLRRHLERNLDDRFAGQVNLRVFRIIGVDGNAFAEVARATFGVDRESGFGEFANGNRTVGPTVKFGTSPAL